MRLTRWVRRPRRRTIWYKPGHAYVAAMTSNGSNPEVDAVSPCGGDAAPTIARRESEPAGCPWVTDQPRVHVSAVASEVSNLTSIPRSNCLHAIYSKGVTVFQPRVAATLKVWPTRGSRASTKNFSERERETSGRDTDTSFFAQRQRIPGLCPIEGYHSEPSQRENRQSKSTKGHDLEGDHYQQYFFHAPLGESTREGYQIMFKTFVSTRS
jgi:hypothetical protein